MLKQYICQWCEHQFKYNVEYFCGGAGGKASRHKGCYSTQVKCPKCARLIPTWKKESTDNVVGKKHIHIRK
jgi:hypothetical protein